MIDSTKGHLVQRTNAIRAAVVTGVMLLISASPPASPDDWERQGDAALAANEYAEALGHFERAAETSADPARLAFKQATAYFHMGRYRDAERFYRCVLESETANGRRTQAYYNLGTTLLYASDGRDSMRLAQAIQNFRRCLQAQPQDQQLLANARVNLELAKLLWKQSSRGGEPPPESDSPENGSADPKPPDKNGSDSSTGTGSPGNADGSRTGVLPGNAADTTGTNRAEAPGAARQPIHIPESEQLQPLSPAEARELLRQAGQRIARERRSMQKAAAGGSSRSYPDW